LCALTLNNTPPENEWILNSDKISIIKKLPCRIRQLGSFLSVQPVNPDLVDWTVELKLAAQAAPLQGAEIGTPGSLPSALVGLKILEGQLILPFGYRTQLIGIFPRHGLNDFPDMAVAVLDE
jgi:hypothetical protein